MSGDLKERQLQAKIRRLLTVKPMKASSLATALEGHFANSKALQRFLRAMVDQNLIGSYGSTSGRTYHLVSRPEAKLPTDINQKAAPQNAASLSEARTEAESVDYLKRPVSERRLTVYDYDRLFTYFPNQTRLLSDETLALLQTTPRHSQADGRKAFEAVFTRQFCFNSTRLEVDLANLNSSDRLLAFRGGRITTKRKAFLINHKRGVEWLLSRVSNDESPDSSGWDVKSFREMNMLLMDGLLESDREGDIRNVAVTLEGTSYQPEANVSNLEIYLNEISVKAGMIMDACEASFFLLLHLTYLNAFYGGNGPTARLLANLPLLQVGRLPHVYHAIEKEDLRQSFIHYFETGDYKPLEKTWLLSYLKGVHLFDIKQESLEAINTQKVELSVLRRAAVRQVVRERLPIQQYEPLAAHLLEGDPLAKKYSPTLLAGEVAKACYKLATTGIGAGLYDLSEAEFKAWLEENRSRSFQS